MIARKLWKDLIARKLCLRTWKDLIARKLPLNLVVDAPMEEEYVTTVLPKITTQLEKVKL